MPRCVKVRQTLLIVMVNFLCHLKLAIGWEKPDEYINNKKVQIKTVRMKYFIPINVEIMGKSNNIKSWFPKTECCLKRDYFKGIRTCVVFKIIHVKIPHFVW